MNALGLLVVIIPLVVGPAALVAQQVVVAPQVAGQQPGAEAAASGLVAGRIVDMSGTPVATAFVFLLKGPASATGPARGSASDRVLADESGRFVFSNVPAGTYRIEASKSGWLSGALGRRRPGGIGSTFDLANGERRNDFAITLWRAAVIGGRVTDDNGDPLIDVEVRAARQVFISGRRQSEALIRAKTDDRGEFRFAGLVPGDYLLAVLSSVLSEPSGFDGVIRASQETPRAYLQTMAAIGSAPMLFDRATGATGPGHPLVASLSPMAGLPVAGGAWPAYPTMYFPSGISMSSAEIVHVSAGDVRADADIRVRLTATFDVSGTVRDAEGPCAWHAVHLVAADSGDTPLVDVATAVTDAGGAFTFLGVPAGRYVARVVRVPWPTGSGRLGVAGGTGAIPFIAIVSSGPNSGPSTPTDPLWHAAEPVTVVDRPVRDLALTLREGPRVRGRARFEGDGTPPTAGDWAAAQILLMPASGRSDNFTWPRAFSSTGEFVSVSVWPGRYLIRATPPPGWQLKAVTYEGRDLSDTAIDLAADLDNVIVTFTSQTLTLKGRVQVEAGAAAEEAAVLVFPVDPALWVDGGRASRRLVMSRVSRASDFTLPLPPAGEYFVIAVPDEVLDDWQNPAFLSKLTPMAERMRVTGNASMTQALQLKRVR